MSSKAREALLAVYDCAKDGVLAIRESAFERVVEALAEPIRNCDVGSTEEQAKRFGDMCDKYYNEEEACDKRCPLASLEPIRGFPRCQAFWSQMPYESEAK